MANNCFIRVALFLAVVLSGLGITATALSHELLLLVLAVVVAAAMASSDASLYGKQQLLR